MKQGEEGLRIDEKLVLAVRCTYCGAKAQSTCKAPRNVFFKRQRPDYLDLKRRNKYHVARVRLAARKYPEAVVKR